MSFTEQNNEQVEILEEELFDYCGDAETTCTICQAEFLDPEDLAIHVNQIHKSTEDHSKKCQFCTSTYSDLMTYAEHLRDKHLLKLKYCQFCLRAFSDADEHRSHENKHRAGSKTSYKCTQCSIRYGNLFDLRRHDLECHNDDLDGVMIQEHLPYLSAALNLKAATLFQALHSDTVFICVGCDYSTANIKLYINHAKTKNCTSYVCDKCSNVYKKKWNLLRHMSKECAKVPGRKTKVCPECHLTFNMYQFVKHKKNCKVIKCHTCGINYETMYELSEHQSKEHPLSVELKTCTFCWKQCVGNVALQKHIDRSHKSELHMYKYLCIYCKSVYKHPQKLFGHFFSKHKDLDPYTCKICNKKFRIRKQFTLHIKLDHKSVGFVEFDENYHVFFAEKKSENPFIPQSIYAKELETKKIGTSHENTEDPSNIEILNVNSEMSITETEGNQTEVETKTKPKLKRKRVPKTNIKETEEPIAVQSSDDEPLLVIKRRVQKSMPKILRNRWTKKRLTSINKKRFTCHICKKYCYTFQNYHHHISLHSKKDYKRCIKCPKFFRSKEKLNNHIATDHSSSRLTETLKCLLEKRKKGLSISDDLPMSERFRRTIKKTESNGLRSTATIKTVDTGLSVQKFIENFTPEAENKSEAEINNAVTLKVVNDAPKKPTIKMTKFEKKPMPLITKLSLPVKFKDCYPNKMPATIKLVQPTPVLNIDSPDNNYHNYDDDMDRNESIPEVAEEVMLEGTEEAPKVVQIPHKIVIPKLPTAYNDITIAHLLPQAPYYKIVKVNEVLNMQNTEKKSEDAKSNTIKLPDGTKLINSNPLAHLLGKTPIDKVLGSFKNKYYKPKATNFQGMLAQALSNLDKPIVKKKRKGPEAETSTEN